MATPRACIGGRGQLKPQRLIDVTYESMLRGIAAVKPGATTGDIGHAIQSYAEGQERCAVVRDSAATAWGGFSMPCPMWFITASRTGHHAQARHVLHH